MSKKLNPDGDHRTYFAMVDYLEKLLKGRVYPPPSGLPSLCDDAYEKLSDSDSVKMLRQYLQELLASPDDANYHLAIKRALYPNRDARYLISWLANVEPPGFLLEYEQGKVLPDRGLSVLYGPPGIGKSFIALDMALQIACAGKRVVYIACEGGYDYSRRIWAWIDHYKADSWHLEDHFEVIPFEPVRLGDAASVAYFEVELAEYNTAFAVIDTLNRASPGIDENSAGEMEAALARAAGLAPSVLVVHHTNRGGKDYRGSSVIESNCDMLIAASAPGGGADLLLQCKKSKYAAPFEPIGKTLLYNAKNDSLVAIRAERATLPAAQHKVAVAVGQGAGSIAAITKKTGQVEGTIKNAVSRLRVSGYMDVGYPYSLTDKGAAYVRDAT